jgi:predicted esterase|tara:strand:- start:2996 stop:4207 length:1212 start_codon:yes stop_codon:yes gene_type:complete
MHQSLIIYFLAILGFLNGSCFAQQKEVFLSFPELKDKIEVSLPEGHDPQKRYPVLFYYHGQAGLPDTSLIRFHTGPKDWIVVGMGYVKQGRIDLSKDALVREMRMFHKVKKQVVEKYGGNIRACYAAGFSKGGWLTDAMLQTEPSLAGGIILGAGKMKQFNQIKTYRQGKGDDKKVIFIGIGRNDHNHTYAYHALMMHRKMSAAVTLEIWRDLGHSIPQSGSSGLKQWLRSRLINKEGLKELAAQETQTAFDAALKLPELEQYFVLRDLSDTPYVKLLGETWEKRINSGIATLTKDKKVLQESLAHSQQQKALSWELKYRNSVDLEKVKRGYLFIQETYADSTEAVLMVKDITRVERLLKLVRQREAEMKSRQAEKSKDKDAEAKGPSRENDRDRIPRNPLIR